MRNHANKLRKRPYGPKKDSRQYRAVITLSFSIYYFGGDAMIFNYINFIYNQNKFSCMHQVINKPEKIDNSSVETIKSDYHVKYITY